METDENDELAYEEKYEEENDDDKEKFLQPLVELEVEEVSSQSKTIND